MLALQNFFLVVVMPIVTFTGIIVLFRWWLQRSTGYDPLSEKSEKSENPPQEQDSRGESYAPYLPPKWREEKKKEES